MTGLALEMFSNTSPLLDDIFGIHGEGATCAVNTNMNATCQVLVPCLMNRN